jgi:hypothetical protein
MYQGSLPLLAPMGHVRNLACVAEKAAFKVR